MSCPFDRHRPRPRGRCAAMVLLTSLVLAGVACSGDEGPEPQSALVQSMWAEDAPVVDVGAPTTLHLPGPDLPDGVILSAVARPDDPPPPELTPDPLDPSGAAQTLYADPSAPVPEAGPALVVGRTQTSDTDGELILVQSDLAASVRTPGAPSGTRPPVDVGHDGAERVEVDDLLVIRWPLPVDCACDQDAFVAARGVDPEVVLAAARTADVGAEQPSIPEAERDGLRSLGTVAGTHRDLPPFYAFPETLTVRRDGAEADVALHRGDPRIVAHARIWAPEGDLVSTFPLLRHTVVLDDGTIAHATAYGDDVAVMEPIVDEVLASLVPATEAEVTAAQTELAASVPLPPCDLGAPTAAPDPARGDLHGTTGTARWVFGITVVDGSLLTCDQVTPVGALDAGAGSGATSATEVDGAAPIELLGASSAGASDGSTNRFVAGHVPDDVTEVVVEATGLAPVRADVADTGPRPGRRWFAAVLDVTPLGLRELQGTVVASRADGSEVGRTSLHGDP